MKKVAIAACSALMSLSLLAGCGGGGSSSSSGGYYTPGYYGEYNGGASQQTQELPSQHHDSGDSSNPAVTGSSDVILDSGNGDSAVFSITGEGFGNYREGGFVTMALKSGAANIDYGVKTWSGDAVNVYVRGLSSPADAVFSVSLTTNAGAVVKCPDVVIKPDGLDDNRGGRVFAVFAGSTADSPLASYCSKDASDMYEALVNYGGFAGWQAVLLNKNSTTSDIRAAFESIISSSGITENDTFLFYYSGHGNENYLAMDHGSDGMRASEIENYLNQLPSGCHKILLIDSCSSGTFLPKDFGIFPEKSIKELSASIPNLAVMAACGPKNDAGASIKLNQSEFTYAMLESLGRTSPSAAIGSPLSLNRLFDSTLERTHYTDQSDKYGYSYPVFKKTGNDCYIK